LRNQRELNFENRGIKGIQRQEGPEWNRLLADMEKQLVKQNSKKLKVKS